jgi:PDZ domain
MANAAGSSEVGEPVAAAGVVALAPVTSSPDAASVSAPTPMGLAPVTPAAATSLAAGPPDAGGDATPPMAADSGSANPPTTEVVPSATEQAPAANPQQANSFSPSDDTLNYERYQNPELYEPQLHSLQEFINEQDNTSAIGVEVRQDQRKLDSGGVATGLLIIGVTPGSPAAKAGLHAHSDTARKVLAGAAIAGAMVFPPAVLLVPILANVPVGEAYDMIIAVDGWRVMNFIDFEDRMRDVQPGEIVYLTIVRNGKRVQVPVQVPQDRTASAGF